MIDLIVNDSVCCSWLGLRKSSRLNTQAPKETNKNESKPQPQPFSDRFLREWGSPANEYLPVSHEPLLNLKIPISPKPQPHGPRGIQGKNGPYQALIVLNTPQRGLDAGACLPLA